MLKSNNYLYTCVPICCLSQKQTDVSHSSSEAEIISLDTGVRMDGITCTNDFPHD